MSLSSKFSYKRLKHEFIYGDDDDGEQREPVIRRRSRSSWIKKLKRINLRRKFKIRIRIPRLRKFFFGSRRRSKVQLSWGKVVRRLRESQAHFGDLFAGNYLFMQVTPDALKAAGNHQKIIMGQGGLGVDHGLHGLFSSRFSNYGLGKT